MPTRCVAGRCDNTPSDSVSLHSFPKDPKLRKEWARQVKRTRAKWNGPTDSSRLCSMHFDSSCFEDGPRLMASFGLTAPNRRERRLVLKPGSCPSIFLRSPSKGLAGSSLPNSKERTAFQKREKIRRSAELWSGLLQSELPAASASVIERSDGLWSGLQIKSELPAASVSVSSESTRELSEVGVIETKNTKFEYPRIAELWSGPQVKSELPDASTSVAPETTRELDEVEMKDTVNTQCENERSNGLWSGLQIKSELPDASVLPESTRKLSEVGVTDTKNTQFEYPRILELLSGPQVGPGTSVVSTSDIGCQAIPDRRYKTTMAKIRLPHKSRGIQVESKLVDVETQCDMLDAPPLHPEPEEPEEDFEDEGARDSLKKTDPDYLPLEEDLELAKEDTKYYDSATMNSEQAEPPNINDEKFIVFKSSLTQLLKWCHCPECGSHDLGQPAFSTNGSQLIVHMSCESCYHLATWQSQPMVDQVPLGNLAISAGIRNAGASPTDVLQVFKHMSMASIAMRTFHRHKKLYPLDAAEDVELG